MRKKKYQKLYLIFLNNNIHRYSIDVGHKVMEYTPKGKRMIEKYPSSMKLKELQEIVFHMNRDYNRYKNVLQDYILEE